MFFSVLFLYLLSKVELEFRTLHSGKENEFLMNYSEYASKLVALAEEEEKFRDCLVFEDSKFFANNFFK